MPRVSATSAAALRSARACTRQCKRGEFRGFRGRVWDSGAQELSLGLGTFSVYGKFLRVSKGVLSRGEPCRRDAVKL